MWSGRWGFSEHGSLRPVAIAKLCRWRSSINGMYEIGVGCCAVVVAEAETDGSVGGAEDDVMYCDVKCCGVM